MATGEVKFVKVGWSWTLFLFANFLGIPLFLRGLNILGVLLIILDIISWGIKFSGSMISDEYIVIAASASMIVSLFMLAVAIWLGMKGNEITAKHYLNKGWVFGNSDEISTKFARMTWKLAA